MMSDLLSDQLPMAPQPAMEHPELPALTPEQLENEAQRLVQAIGQEDRWDLETCRFIAPLTFHINRLKKEQDVFLMAHSYQTPDIVYGVADAVGDSYGLAKAAKESSASTILFSSVRFMAETAKIVNPGKRVLHPTPEAGCSLSEGITAQDVRDLKAKYPGAPVVCYINTTAAVKAECDACVTSSNYVDVCRKLEGDQLLFVPDRLMGEHLQRALAGEKEVILWDADCQVHAEFTPEVVTAWKDRVAAQGKTLKVLAHPECSTGVVEVSDYVGSSEKIMEEARKYAGQEDVLVLPITECGTADRLRKEQPTLQITGSCAICPHMKRTDLGHILNALLAPTPEQIVELDADVIERANLALERMFELAN